MTRAAAGNRRRFLLSARGVDALIQTIFFLHKLRLHWHKNMIFINPKIQGETFTQGFLSSFEWRCFQQIHKKIYEYFGLRESYNLGFLSKHFYGFYILTLTFYLIIMTYTNFQLCLNFFFWLQSHNIDFSSKFRLFFLQNSDCFS